MTKADLSAEVSAAAKIPRDHSEVLVEAIFESILRSLSYGDKIEIRGFGSFGMRQHVAREITNPKTGKRVGVPAQQVPYFEPSTALKKFINKPNASLAPPPRSGSPRSPKT